jgi:hypothetical protein
VNRNKCVVEARITRHPFWTGRPLKKSLIFFTMKRPSNIFKIKASKIDYMEFDSNKSGTG